MAIRVGKWAGTGLLAATVFAVQAVVPLVNQELGVNAPLGLVNAQEEAEKKPERKTRKTPALRNKVYEKLQEVQAAAEANDLATAKEVLEGMRTNDGKNKLNSYELAQMWNMYAFIYFQEENFPKAIEAYQNLVAQPDIPEQMEINTKFSIGQLQMATEDYPAAVKTFEEWFKVATNPGPNAYMMIAQAYIQTKAFKKAVTAIETALAKNEERGKPPKEQWLLLARYAYFETGQVDKMIGVLETLITLYSKRDYWLQLAQMYAEKQQDVLAMVTMETAYRQDMLQRESELLNMASFYMGNDVPYKAAKVLEKAMAADIVEDNEKNLRFLGNAWRASQEVKKAIPVLAQAAKKSKDGEASSRLASVYLDNDQFASAEKAAEDAIRKGGVKRMGDLYIVKGMAEFYQNKYKSAKESFKKAGNEDKKSKKAADQWIKYVESEMKRKEKLADGLV